MPVHSAQCRAVRRLGATGASARCVSAARSAGTFTQCGSNTSTTASVPTSSAAAKSPKSRKAEACSGTKAAKAPTVVTLPMSKGEASSRKLRRTSPACRKWATKCSG